jgi:hypothetical protein
MKEQEQQIVISKEDGFRITKACDEMLARLEAQMKAQMDIEDEEACQFAYEHTPTELGDWHTYRMGWRAALAHKDKQAISKAK